MQRRRVQWSTHVERIEEEDEEKQLDNRGGKAFFLKNSIK